jgi:hypothetical protein
VTTDLDPFANVAEQLAVHLLLEGGGEKGLLWSWKTLRTQKNPSKTAVQKRCSNNVPWRTGFGLPSQRFLIISCGFFINCCFFKRASQLFPCKIFLCKYEPLNKGACTVTQNCRWTRAPAAHVWVTPRDLNFIRNSSCVVQVGLHCVQRHVTFAERKLTRKTTMHAPAPYPNNHASVVL